MLAGRGATVAMAARRTERLEALGAEIAENGGAALPVALDVSDREGAEAAVGRTVEELGRLDVLVNNAGVMLLGPMLEAPVEEWERMVEVNLLGLMYMTKAAIPHLLEAAGGERGVADVVNISSVAGRIARRNSGVYNATKFGVGAFSESLRQEVTRQHVRIALVEPGAVATELQSHNRAGVKEEIEKRFEDMEILQAEDIADAIGYVVTRPRHVAVNEVLVRPTEQEG